MRYCSKCKKEKTDQYCFFCKKETNNNYEMNVEVGTYTMRQPLVRMAHKRPGIKRPLTESHVGWQESGAKSKHPEGVNISRIVDRVNNRYEETITDSKTGEIVRDVKEPLDQHISSNQKNKLNKNI